jgi:kanamycin kinase/aminoglycoside 3'-phosphotransferase-3
MKVIVDKEYSENTYGKTDSKLYIFDDMVLKIQKQINEARNECFIAQKISSKLPVPKIIEYKEENDFSYTLMSKINGKMLCDDEILKNPKLLINLLIEGLKMLWSVDINDCNIDNVSNIKQRLKTARYNVENNLVDVNNVIPDTFGPNGFETPNALLVWLENNIPDIEPVFSHGDYCMENIFTINNKISGFIDLGKSGIADRWQDLAICIRELDGVFSNEYLKNFDYSNYSSDMLLKELGIKRNDEKLKYYMLLDELF